MSNFISATIRKRLFMIFHRDLPYQVRYDYRLNQPRWELSHIQIIPGPTPSAIPIFRLRKTDHEYYRFPNLISAARYVKKLRSDSSKENLIEKN